MSSLQATLTMNKRRVRHGLTVPDKLWQRVEAIAARMEPPYTVSALMLYAIAQFIDRQEQQQPPH